MSLQFNDRLVWPGGRKKAFTLSFDDGVQQDLRLLQMLERYGAKCTFNLNPGLFGKNGKVSAGGKEAEHNKLSGDRIRQVYGAQEIAGHGMYHVRLDGMDCARITKEVLACREALEKIAQHPVTGFCYAFGGCDAAVRQAVQACGISYSRTIRPSYSFQLPRDFLEWDPTCHYRDERLFALADEFVKELAGRRFQHTKLFYVWGHSYEFEQYDDWDRMERLLDKMVRAGGVWFATNGQIRQYVQAFRRLVFTLDGRRVFNPSALQVCVGGSFTAEYVEAGPGQTVELIPAREV